MDELKWHFIESKKSRVYKLFFLMLTGLCCFAQPVLAKAPTQTTAVPSTQTSLMHYYNSGKYFKDIAKTVRSAMYYLAFRIHQNARLKKPKKLAMVLGVDETTLSNYNHIQQMGFGSTYQDIVNAQTTHNDPAIPYMKTLYNFAKKNHVAIFFITNRNEHLRESTINNLHKMGYTGWKALYMKPNYYYKKSTLPFHIRMRKKIMAMGYDIVVNIDNQKSALKGGYSSMVFKLPNPFYSVG